MLLTSKKYSLEISFPGFVMLYSLEIIWKLVISLIMFFSSMYDIFPKSKLLSNYTYWHVHVTDILSTTFTQYQTEHMADLQV